MSADNGAATDPYPKPRGLDPHAFFTNPDLLRATPSLCDSRRGRGANARLLAVGARGRYAGSCLAARSRAAELRAAGEEGDAGRCQHLGDSEAGRGAER